MNKFRDLAAIAFTLTIPTLITLVYFLWLKDAESVWQQTAYGIGKVLQFGFPIVYVACFFRDRLRWKPGTQQTTTSIEQSSSLPTSSEPQPTSAGNVGLAIAFGCLVATAIFTIYFTMLPAYVTDKLELLVAEKIRSIGFDSVGMYFGLAVFYTGFHSLMEEYYWRWFVFDMLQRHVPTWTANLVSSIGFMAHHVIVLGFFFGWGSPLTYGLSLCISVGGSFWAWLYDRERRLRNVWISHAIVDAAIFGVGYFLVFQK